MFRWGKGAGVSAEKVNDKMPQIFIIDRSAEWEGNNEDFSEERGDYSLSSSSESSQALSTSSERNTPERERPEPIDASSQQLSTQGSLETERMPLAHLSRNMGTEDRQKFNEQESNRPEESLNFRARVIVEMGVDSWEHLRYLGCSRKYADAKVMKFAKHKMVSTTPAYKTSGGVVRPSSDLKQRADLSSDRLSSSLLEKDEISNKDNPRSQSSSILLFGFYLEPSNRSSDDDVSNNEATFNTSSKI